MKAPFIYGVTVSTSAFTNRVNDQKKLYDNLNSGINTMLISPRRWGKSSLVEKVASKLDKEKDVRIVMIDLFTVRNQHEFLELLGREVIKASSSKWEDWIEATSQFFKKVVPRISIGLDPEHDFTLGFDINDAKKYEDEILNLAQIIAKEKKLRFIICIDEFQNLASFPNYDSIEKKMRAIWQRQKDVTYCLYGSKRHMMSDIFNSPSKPFYRFGDIILLQKIARKDWVKYIRGAFKKTDKLISKELATVIPSLMKDHSWYVQQLSHYCWNKTIRETGREELFKAFSELIYANTPFYQNEVESLSRTQLNLVKAIVAGETKLTASKVMADYKLGTPRNVSKNRDSLLLNDMLYHTADAYELLDPAFEIWFRTVFFRESLNQIFEESFEDL